MSINKVIISGNLTRDCEIAYTSTGTPIAKFGIAVNERRKNSQTGEWEDEPNFFNCTMFGTRAEKLQPHLTKGLKACVQGRLHYSSWETDDGKKRSSVDITVEEIEFMTKRDSSQQNEPYGAQTSATPNYTFDGNTAAHVANKDVYNDIPF